MPISLYFIRQDNPVLSVQNSGQKISSEIIGGSSTSSQLPVPVEATRDAGPWVNYALLQINSKLCKCC